jgi:hypothetical protein
MFTDDLLEEWIGYELSEAAEIDLRQHPGSWCSPATADSQPRATSSIGTP